MQVSALPPVWIAMIISCWSVKRLKLSSVTLTHVCGTNSHNWWAKGLPGVGVVKIFCDSDSLGWKSFRLRLLDSDSDSTALVLIRQFSKICSPIQSCPAKIGFSPDPVRPSPDPCSSMVCYGTDDHYPVFGWISGRIVSLQPDMDIQKLLSNGNRISETVLSIFRGFRL